MDILSGVAHTARMPRKRRTPPASLVFPRALPAHGDRPFLLDVREVVEHQLVKLEGDVLIPLGELVSRQQELDPDLEIVVYCHHGLRSVRATGLLLAAGYRARNLTGGLMAWIDRVDPSLLRY